MPQQCVLTCDHTLQAIEAVDERTYWAVVLPDAVAGYDAQVSVPNKPWCSLSCKRRTQNFCAHVWCACKSHVPFTMRTPVGHGGG